MLAGIKGVIVVAGTLTLNSYCGKLLVRVMKNKESRPSRSVIKTRIDDLTEQLRVAVATMKEYKSKSDTEKDQMNWQWYLVYKEKALLIEVSRNTLLDVLAGNWDKTQHL